MSYLCPTMRFMSQLRYNPKTPKNSWYYRIKESFRNLTGRARSRVMLNVGFISEEHRPEDIRDIGKYLTYLHKHQTELDMFGNPFSKYNEFVQSKPRVISAIISVVKPCSRSQSSAALPSQLVAPVGRQSSLSTQHSGVSYRSKSSCGRAAPLWRSHNPPCNHYKSKTVIVQASFPICVICVRYFSGRAALLSAYPPVDAAKRSLLPLEEFRLL